MNELIRNRDAMRQIRNFNGMRFGTISPTDIDGFLEIRDRLFIFIETKHNGAELPTGQRLALERLNDAASVTRKTITIIGRHNEPFAADIDVASCLVSSYYEKKQWLPTPYETCTVRELAEMFIELSFGEEGTTR